MTASSKAMADPRRGTLRTAAALLLAVAAGARAQAQEPAGELGAPFEERVLENGLRVWFKYLPEDLQVSVSLVLPFGSAEDPPGKEELAHFIEHMLLGDHDGRTEEEIKREIEDLGGTRRAFTYFDHSFYRVRIGKEHGLMAVDWLAKVIEPHEMLPERVDKQRSPIAIELEAKPRDIWEWLEAHYVDPPLLRMPGLWKREFGLDSRQVRDYDPYRSIVEIAPEDLAWFYETYYVPSLMTLVVVGDFDREELFARVEETFGRLPARPEPPYPREIHNPERPRREFSWEFRPDVEYVRFLKFYSPSSDDHVRVLFLRDYLEQRLNNRLRFGERKVAYVVNVGMGQFLPGVILQIKAGIRTGEIEFARAVVREELDALRNGSIPEEEFESTRSSLVDKFRTETTTAEDWEWYAHNHFYGPRMHAGFPPIFERYTEMTKAEMVEFARRLLAEENEVLQITYPFPFSQGVLVAAAALLVLISIVLARRWLGGAPVELYHVRYMAPFAYPPLFLLGATFALLVVLGGGGRLLYFLYDLLRDRFLIGVDSFVVQWSVVALLIVAALLLLLWLASRLPTAIIAFEDRVVIKHLAFRKVVLRAEDLEEVELRGFGEVWRSARLLRTVALTFGWRSPGIFLKPRQGKSYFFRVDHPTKMLEELQSLCRAAA